MFVNKDGTGRYEALVESMTLGAGGTSVFDADGSAIVVTQLRDDNVTDPAVIPAIGSLVASLPEARPKGCKNV
jgi:Cu/Zn superoxide dismutase